MYQYNVVSFDFNLLNFQGVPYEFTDQQVMFVIERNTNNFLVKSMTDLGNGVWQVSFVEEDTAELSGIYNFFIVAYDSVQGTQRVVVVGEFIVLLGPKLL